MQNPRDNFCCVALSDNQNLIEEYCKINYLIKYVSTKGEPVSIPFIDYAKKGELVAAFSLCVLNALMKNLEQLRSSLTILKRIIETKKSAVVLLPDYELLSSLLVGDKDEIKRNIEIFTKSKLHNQRMRDELILKQFISQPAILFLKLSWILGHEIEIKNELIPMDLMPVKPLKNYKEDYKKLLR